MSHPPKKKNHHHHSGYLGRTPTLHAIHQSKKESTDLTTGHTIIIEADIKPTKHSSNRVHTRSLCRRILELGDANIKNGWTLVDPCLRCYTGAFFVCNSTEGLKDKGTGNGTQCRILSVKLKTIPHVTCGKYGITEKCGQCVHLMWSGSRLSIVAFFHGWRSLWHSLINSYVDKNHPVYSNIS